MNISINQALNFWNQLVRCYFKVSRYDRDTCEIYLYTMMEHYPTFANNPDSIFVKEEVEGAKEAMRSLIRRFETEYECRVIEEDGTLTLEGTYRFHLQVVHNPQ